MVNRPRTCSKSCLLELALIVVDMREMARACTRVCIGHVSRHACALIIERGCDQHVCHSLDLSSTVSFLESVACSILDSFELSHIIQIRRTANLWVDADVSKGIFIVGGDIAEV